MAKDNKQNIENEIIATETVVEATKLVKDKAIDFSGGKVQVITEGYADGEMIEATVNGVVFKAEVFDNLAIICTGSPFKNYPSVIFS